MADSYAPVPAKRGPYKNFMTIPLDRRYLLLIGVGLLLFAVASTLTGETIEARRYGSRFIERSEEPKRFWWNIVGSTFAGLCFVGLYLYEISN
jgi:hypothetical protein